MQKEYLLLKQAPGIQKWDTFPFKMVYNGVRVGHWGGASLYKTFCIGLPHCGKLSLFLIFVMECQ